MKKDLIRKTYLKKRQELNLLDIIEFSDRNSKNTFTAIITELSYFKNFKDAIEEVGIKKVLPNARCLKEGLKYMKVSHMGKEQHLKRLLPNMVL